MNVRHVSSLNKIATSVGRLLLRTHLSLRDAHLPLSIRCLNKGALSIWGTTWGALPLESALNITKMPWRAVIQIGDSKRTALRISLGLLSFRNEEGCIYEINVLCVCVCISPCQLLIESVGRLSRNMVRTYMWPLQGCRFEFSTMKTTWLTWGHVWRELTLAPLTYGPEIYLVVGLQILR